MMTTVKQMSLSAAQSPKCTFRIKSALFPVGSDGSSYLINIDDTIYISLNTIIHKNSS